MTVNEQIGKKIRILRKEKGLGQGEFGKLFNMTQNAVTNIETGKRNLPYEDLLKIANFFGVTTDYIIKENGVRIDEPELQSICDYTGLKEKTIEFFKNKDQNDKKSIAEFIEFMIDDYACLFELKFGEIPLYAADLYDLYPKITEYLGDTTLDEKQRYNEIKELHEKICNKQRDLNSDKYLNLRALTRLLDKFAVVSMNSVSIQDLETAKAAYDSEYEIYMSPYRSKAKRW